MKDLYDILEIKKDASSEEIKQAYKKKAVQHHPDKQGGDNTMMVEVNRSYNILSDPNKRDRYDKTGKEAETPFDQKFMGLIHDIMATIIDQANVDEQNIIDIFKEIIAGTKKKCEDRLKEYEKKLVQAKSIKKRLTTKKNTTLISVAEMNISEMSKSIFILTEEKDFFEKALLVLNDYSYKFDKIDPMTFAGYEVAI